MQERKQHANGIPTLARSQVERRGRSTVTQEQNPPPKASGIRKEMLALDSIIIMGNTRRGQDYAREKQDVTSGKPRRGRWGREFRLYRTWSTAVVAESLSSTLAEEMRHMVGIILNFGALFVYQVY